MKRLIPWIPILGIFLVFWHVQKYGDPETRQQLFPTNTEFILSAIFNAILSALIICYILLKAIL